MKVPLAIADIGEEDVAGVVEALRSGWLTHGPNNARFEEAFAELHGVRHAICMNSCASALHLSILGLGVTGEVILPSFTFVASANAVVTAGATPVFADIEYDTCNLDPDALEAAITPRTEAIMPVHFAGQSCDMDRIMAIAERHKLAVIEDSAEAVGAEFRGKKTGTFGVGCFSFYPTKNMTTGEGGMLTTDDDELAGRVRTYMAHGVSSMTLSRERLDRPWLRAATLPGYNFRLSNVLAALGVTQLAKLEQMNLKRREHAAWYTEQLAEVGAFDLPVERDDCFHVWQMYTVKLREGDRTALLAQLREAGVGASVHFDPPVHPQPFYAETTGGATPDLPVTDRVASTIFTLPLFPSMTSDQREHVVRTAKSALAAPTASGA